MSHTPPETEDDAGVPSAFLAEAARIDRVRPRDPDLTGRRLGHFRVERCVGRGGMGVVYEALDPRLGRRVALKVLFAWAGDDERRARFLREARSAAAVSHAHVATVLDIGESEGIPFIAMELLPGPTLRELLVAAGGRFDPRRAVTTARDIALGLACLHAAGIVHRDLKPENVMTGADGRLKIVDFGLARFHDEAAAPPGDSELDTEEGRVIGTPGYMSPEQARGARLDPRSDVFTLGVILYELLAGQRPFQGRSAAETSIQIARDPAPPLARLVPTIDRRVERLVAACLAKDPAARPASAEQVALGLDALLLPGSRSWRWIALATGLGVLGLAWSGSRQRVVPQAEPPRATSTAASTAKPPPAALTAPAPLVVPAPAELPAASVVVAATATPSASASLVRKTSKSGEAARATPSPAAPAPESDEELMRSRR